MVRMGNLEPNRHTNIFQDRFRLINDCSSKLLNHNEALYIFLVTRSDPAEVDSRSKVS